MKRMISLLLAILILVPACALAELRRGDSGEEVISLQQMLWDTGFIFEEPDGVFGRNTENAVKWFQEYANLEQNGVVDDRTLDSLYACWLRVMDENGINMDFSDDDIEGDYPVCCQSYTTNEGDEHVELCGRHAELAADTTLPAVEKWKGELNVLYGEWLAASREGDRAAIAFSQAFFTLWLEQQTHALQHQNAENVDSSIEAILRNHCVGLCRTVFELTIE